MRRLKKVLCIVMVLMVFFSTTAFAQANTDRQNQKQIEKLFKKYGYNTIDWNATNAKVSVNSLEELEAILKAHESVVDIERNQITYVSVEEFLTTAAPVNTTQDFGIQSIYPGSTVLTWYHPFQGFGGSIACWRNIALQYTYEFVGMNMYFRSAQLNTSYVTGATMIDWVHVGGFAIITSSYRPGDTISATANGYFELIVNFGMFTVGARKNDTWYRNYVVN